MTDAPREIHQADLETTGATLSTIALAAGGSAAQAVALIDGLVVLVDLLVGLGRLERVEATATERHEMTVEP